MSNRSALILLVATALTLAACTDHAPHRTRTIAADGDLVCDVANGPDGRNGRGDCALERHGYEVELGFGEPQKHYHLAFVEFDDQGWFWDRKQMEALLRLLYRGSPDGELRPEQDFLIFVFAHGWRHDAGACDDNVVCFQRMVERLDVLERVEAWRSGGEPRPVIGVYLGWRGLSTTLRDVPLLEQASAPLELASFWERKSTAQRVGLGGVTELLSRLNDFRRHKNVDRQAGKTQLLIFGHSFGGKVIYAALSHSLIERAVFTETCAPGHEQWRPECGPDGQGARAPAPCGTPRPTASAT